MRLRRIQTVGDRLPRLQTDQECRGFCVIEIQYHRLRLGNETAEEGSQLVQRFMVQGDVVHDCDTRLEQRYRAISLVPLTHGNLALAYPGSRKTSIRSIAASHTRPISDRRTLSAAMKNPAEHPDRGRLTARACDTDTQGGRVEQLGEKLRASGDGSANTARSLHVENRLFHSGGRHQDLTGPRNATAILRMEQHTACTQKIESFDVAPLVQRPVRALNQSTPGLDD